MKLKRIDPQTQPYTWPEAIWQPVIHSNDLVRIRALRAKGKS